MIRSLTRGLVAGLAFVLVLDAAASRAGEAQQLIVVQRGAMSQTPVDWPFFVAQANGYFTREGLDVQQTLVDPPTTVSALIGGSLDIVSADTTGLVLADDKGSDLVGVGPVADRNPYYLMASPDVKTVAELKGKKISTPSPIEIYTSVIRDVLKKAGLDPDKDVTWVYGGGQGQRFAAMVGGAVNAGLLSSPADAKARKLGFNDLVFMPDVVPSLALSVIAVRKDWAEQHADVVRRYLRATADAIAWLNNPANKDKAIDILAAASKATPEEAQTAYAYWVGKHIFNETCANPARFDSLFKILAAQNRLTTLKVTDTDKVVDTAFCPK